MGLRDGFRKLVSKFVNYLPENANRSTAGDRGNVAKTSPWLFDYDVFKMNWEKVALLREIDEMMRSDPRLKRANHVFATTAIRRGLNIRVSSDVSTQLAKKAQTIVDELVRMSQLNSKLLPWARSLLKDGELYLNPVIDTSSRKIIDIKNLPAITMQRNEDITGRFEDPNDAFRQIDPISRAILTEFPLWAINHIRHDHEPGQLYGNSQYLTCRAIWKKLKMMEEDLVVRRRTRAVPRRLHTVGTKDDPGSWDEVDRYKSENSLNNPKLNQITTDYFGNGLTDVKDLNADAYLDHIGDVEYQQELLLIGASVPLHILGFGKGVNRDVLEDQVKQFTQDVDELRDLIEYGDESSYSGLRSILDFALSLQGINPSLVNYNFMWAETDEDTVDKKVDRIIKLRSSQPSPTISRKFALTYLGRDVGLENEEAIAAEIEAIQSEMEENKKEQEIESTSINPIKPSTSPTDRVTQTSAGKPVKDSKSPLRSKKAVELEKSLADEVTQFFSDVYETMEKNGMEAKIENILKLKSVHQDSQMMILDDYTVALMKPHAGCTCSQCITDAKREVPLNQLVEQNVIDELDAAWEEHQDELTKTFKSHYAEIGAYAFEHAFNQVAVSVSFDFVHSGVKQDLEQSAADRVAGIEETTKNLLRKQLAEAYEKALPVDEWVSKIQSVMDIPKWRAETIATSELSWAFNQANMSAYKEAGITKVKWLAVMDKRTCSTCASHNGKEYQLSDLPSIPAHPLCRCSTHAVI